MSGSAASMGEELARSIHPEKVFAFLLGMTTANLAALYGLDEPAYAAIRDRFAAQTAAAARDLLAEPAFAAAVDRLPFADGQTLAVIGESTTDAADSWLEILGHLIGLLRPGAAIMLVNAAISGYPTTMLQRVMAETTAPHPHPPAVPGPVDLAGRRRPPRRERRDPRDGRRWRQRGRPERRLRQPPDTDLLSADGLHPTLAGQKAIAKRFVQRLADSSEA